MDVQGPAAKLLVEQFIADSKEDDQTLSAAGDMLERARALKDECDTLLSRHARHWDLARLALVDRNILRLAVCELISGQPPFKVVIAEALKLAQEFSTAESPRFINGVLDAVARELNKPPDNEGGEQ